MTVTTFSSKLAMEVQLLCIKQLRMSVKISEMEENSEDE